ncbi:MAG TPA: BadF/BadG/BcrA/BcrD ATPase family protein [Segeticoccus sp.]|jgi:N-acetylglucosamine kinase-like BadF-type ATPase|nr:BadF/BadG/BcrA/BcrD ATPase family protein [Segeticoccus sp.]
MGSPTDTSPRRPLVVGADIGGTSTRVVLASDEGELLGRGTAGPANPTANTWDRAGAAISSALSQALGDRDPAQVRAAVLGVAGGGALAGSRLAEPFRKLWTASGIGAPPAIVGDLDVAFTGATARPDGTVLIAGTGAVAGAIRGHTAVRMADGHGWLLGDAGSGFWLGREAVGATLRELDAGGPLSRLGESVVQSVLSVDEDDDEVDDEEDAAVATPAETRVRVIGRVYRRRPQELARLAPLVSAAAGAGDPVAREIVRRAAEALLRTVGRCRAPDERTPLVLAGSVLGRASAVGAVVRDLVGEQLAGPVLDAGDGARGAAWLAIRRLVGDPDALRAAHERLTSS